MSTRSCVVGIASPYTFAHGETEVTCVAADAAGNVGTETFSVTVSYVRGIELVLNELRGQLPAIRSSG